MIDCGRRFGKNILEQDIATVTALDGHPVGWGAPTYKMLLDDWKSLANILAPVTVRRNEQEKTLKLVTDGVIEFFSLDNPDAIRGKKFKGFIVNEAAFVPELVQIFNLVIRPTLIDFQGWADFAGTPKGMNGFWQLYNNTGDDWAKWKMSSYENPHIPKAELDGLKETMIERAWMQEIMAEFLEDGGGVFRNVMKCSRLGARPPEAGHQYVIGADWGRTEDATVFCVLDVGTSEQVYMDRMTDTDFASQRIRLQALAQRYNNAVCMVEENSIGRPQLEEIQRMGINALGFTTTNATKHAAISSLQLALESGTIALLDNDVQVNELMAYQAERLPSGNMRYGAPSGTHDDTVMALAIAWYAGKRGKVEAMESLY